MTIGISSGGMIPEPFTSNNSGVNTILIDAANEQAGQVFQAQKTGNIAKLHFAVSSLTTDATLDGRLETVDGSGNPSGTLLGTLSNGSVTTAGVGSYFVTLTTPVAVVVGDDIAATIVNPSTSFGNMRIVGGRAKNHIFPYTDFFNGTVWSKQEAAPAFGIEYDDGTFDYAPYSGAIESQTSIGFSSSSVPDERGNKYVLPYKVRVIGFWIFGDLDQPSTMNLYNAADSVLLSKIILPANLRNTNPGISYRRFGSPGFVDIEAGVVFRQAILPTTTSNIAAYQFNFLSAASIESMPLGGDCINTERTDAGAWTDNTNERMNMGLVTGGFDDAAGGGGGGGMKLIGVGGLVG